MGYPYEEQLRAAKAEGELAAIRDALREFAEENGLNPEMEPRDLLAKAAGAFRSCAAMSDARYAEIRELRAEMEAMRPRLMPEGMEWLVEKWPRFEDGVPLGRGDEVVTSCGTVKVDDLSLTMFDEDGGVISIDFGDRIKRPAPKVRDADGVEIREKGDVWWICEGDDRGIHAERLRVETIGPNGLIECSPYNGGTWVYLEPSELYVNKPVPAADGRPLREGETAWSVDSGTRYTVEKITDELIPIKCCSEMGSTVSLHPSQLTHERPVVDTWERWREDAAFSPSAYCDKYRIGRVGYEELDTNRDLVRRAKKLPERDES